MSTTQLGIDHTGVWTARQYTIDAGWDWSCIEATARLGVAEADAEGLSDAQQASLLDYCRMNAVKPPTLSVSQLREARRQLASAGGQKRMSLLSPEQKRTLGQKGANTRWARTKSHLGLLAESHRRQFNGEDYQAVQFDLHQRFPEISDDDLNGLGSAPTPGCECGFCANEKWLDS